MSHSKKRPPPPRKLPHLTLVASQEIHIPTEEESFRSLFITHPEPMWVFDLKTLQCLELARKHRGRIHLLLTDVVMGMRSRELAKRLTAQRGVKVLYMSGYNSDLTGHHGILDAILLEKPFTLHSLLTKVYKVRHTSQSVKGAAS